MIITSFAKAITLYRIYHHFRSPLMHHHRFHPKVVVAKLFAHRRTIHYNCRLPASRADLRTHTKDSHLFLSKSSKVKFGGTSFLSCVFCGHTVRPDPGGEVLLYPCGEVTAEAPVYRITLPPIRHVVPEGGSTT